MGKGDKFKPSVNTNPNILAVTAWGTNGSLPNATGVITPDSYPSIDGVNQGNGQIVFTLDPSIPFPDWGFTILVKCEGYQDYSFRVDPSHDGNSFDVNLKPTQVLPNFTRDQICGAQVTLSGLTINTVQFGVQPWFELAYQCLSSFSDRQAVRDQKKTAGDTGIIIEFFTNQGYIYPEPGTWLNQCISLYGEFNLQQFRNLVLETLYDGMVPVIVYDGDNGEDPNNGYPNALRQLPILTSLLADVNHLVLYARFWDGVFYGTTPDQIQNFGKEFRKLLPQGHLAIEFNPGHIPVGNGPSDYQPGGMMQDYDVIVGEFEFPDYAQDSTWQVVARLNNPYFRPSDQPANDDPNPPYYLSQPNPRGKFYSWCMEVGAYQWVRKQVSFAELQNVGLYFRNMGAKIVGLPR